MTNASPYSTWWLPLNISTHGEGIDRLINILHWFMLVLFVGWFIYFVYCLIRFRARPGHEPDVQNRHFKLPTYIEAGIVVVEVMLLLFVSSPIWAKYKTDFPPESDSLVVRVVAEQFAWNVHYPGRDGKFGRTEAKLMDSSNPLGIDREDPDAKDDIFTINQLNVPVNKPVIVQLSSKDVIHSFALTVARVKQDAIPGMMIPVWFQATQVGEFEIACAQLCGNGHYRMRGFFNVKTPEDFQAFLDEEHKTLMEESNQ